MDIFTNLPSEEFPKSKVDEIRSRHMNKFVSISNPSVKDLNDANLLFQQEINDERKKYLSSIRKERKKISEENERIFLSDPVGCINYIQSHKNYPSFSIGEILQLYGIGKSTIKRFGKGTLVGKGSDYPYIRSNFNVTAQIGVHQFEENICGSNDKRSKDDLVTMVLEKLALRISKMAGDKND